MAAFYGTCRDEVLNPIFTLFCQAKDLNYNGLDKVTKQLADAFFKATGELIEGREPFISFILNHQDKMTPGILLTSPLSILPSMQKKEEHPAHESVMKLASRIFSEAKNEMPGLADDPCLYDGIAGIMERYIPEEKLKRLCLMAAHIPNLAEINKKRYVLEEKLVRTVQSKELTLKEFDSIKFIEILVKTAQKIENPSQALFLISDVIKSVVWSWTHSVSVIPVPYNHRDAIIIEHFPLSLMSTSVKTQEFIAKYLTLIATAKSGTAFLLDDIKGTLEEIRARYYTEGDSKTNF